MEEKPLSAAPF